MNRIERFAEAIKVHEGYFYGSRSYRNNNPGNLKFVGQAHAKKEVNGSFCVFDTYENGWQALINMIKNALQGKSNIYSPTMTVLQFFEKYAPSADANDPVRYAQFVADYVGFSITSELEELTIDPDAPATPEAQAAAAPQLRKVRVSLGDRILLEGEIVESSIDPKFLS